MDSKRNKINDWRKEEGATWLKMHHPNVRKLDHDWTMERYGYPQFVRQYIKENWITVSNNNGGTYAEPVWWKSNKHRYYHIF